MEKMKYIYIILFIFLFTSCKKASFKETEGLTNTSFDIFNQIDNTYNLRILNQNKNHSVFLKSASFNNNQILETSLSEAAAFEETAVDYKFQNYTLALKDISGKKSFYIAPYLSKFTNINVATTALYLFIQNSLPYEEFSKLNIGESQWNQLLQEYQNTCTNCLEKNLRENINTIIKDDYFWFKIKRDLGNDLSWTKKPLSHWNWVLLESHPKADVGNKVRLYEGEKHTFRACFYHPSLDVDCSSANFWEHDFETHETLQRANVDIQEVEIGYDKNENLTYSVNFGIDSHAELPDVNHSFQIFIANTNRPAQLSTPLPEINLFAGQETKVNLLNYFEDPDNSSESMIVIPENTSSLLQFEYPSDLIVYGPATAFNVGTHEFKFKIRDSLNFDTKTHSVTVNILPNTPPKILYAYKNNNKAVKYNNNDTVDFVEGDKNQFLTLVAEDINGDRTTIELTNESAIRSTYTYDPSNTFGVINPRNGSFKFDYKKTGFLFYSPGDQLSEQRFEIRPSYYQTVGASDSTVNLDFKVLSSEAVSDPAMPVFKPITLPPIDRDEFRLQVRIVNFDDPPVYPGAQIAAPSVDEGQLYSLDLNSLVTPTDALGYNPSSVTLSRVSVSSNCKWIIATDSNISGTPPYDSGELCTVSYRLFDSAKALHGSERAPNDLRTSDFTVRVLINNVNRPPQILNGLPTDLGTYDEGQFFEIKLMDIRPSDGLVNGHFFDEDFDLSDPDNPFIDPLETFTFDCLVSIQGQNDYAPCDERGLDFRPNGNEVAFIDTNFDLVKNIDAQAFDLKLGFKDRVSPGFIYKNLTLTVKNKAAPVYVNFEQSSINMREEELRTAKLIFKRFSDDPIDIYPFKLTLDCFSCQEIITSHFRENFFNKPGDSTRLYYEIDVILEPDFTHGNGDGDKETYVFNARTESLAKSYADGAEPHDEPTQGSSTLVFIVSHVNKPPSAIKVEENKNTSPFVINVDKNFKGNAVDTFNINVVDQDPQDTVFDIRALNTTPGGLIEFSGNTLSLNYLKCPRGGETFNKTVTIRGADSSGAFVTRDVMVTLRNVKSNSIDCR